MSIVALLNLDKERILAPDRPDLLVQEVTRLLFVEYHIVMPKDLGQHEPAFSIREVLTNTVSGADRERLISGIVVVAEAGRILVQETLGEKLEGSREVVISEVGTKVTDTSTRLLQLAEVPLS